MKPAGKARLLAIMGSGETSPTMVKVHRELLGRVGGPSAAAVVIDTPFGFQENAGDLTARAVEYFRTSVGHDLGVVSLRAVGSDPLADEVALARLREADYAFAGPGSPSYALRQWQGSDVPNLLVDKLRHGGCVTFASAAALTLGIVTVPVYEIYKVGAEPAWLEGLDLLGEVGLRAAVIPHYDNAEGGTHDTRFCYLGERRLQDLEAALPPGAFVLGVDEHTALVLDLDAATATVKGLGGVTVRRGNRSVVVPAGETVAIDELASLATSGGPPAAGRSAGSPGSQAAPSSAELPSAASPLMEAVAGAERAFSASLGGGGVAEAVRAALALDDDMVAWANDSLQSDQRDRGRAALRSMIVRLGQLAEAGARDPADAVGPFVEALLEQRRHARAEGRYDDADAIRDRLVALGVEVRDAPEGTTWRLVP